MLIKKIMGFLLVFSPVLFAMYFIQKDHGIKAVLKILSFAIFLFILVIIGVIY